MSLYPRDISPRLMAEDDEPEDDERDPGEDPKYWMEP